jgi:hypothetical protein
MADYKEKAEKLKFLCRKKNIQPATEAFQGLMSLKAASRLGIYALAGQEILYQFFFWNCYGNEFHFWYIYIVLISLMRMGVSMKLGKGIRNNDFPVCAKLYNKMTKLTKFQIFNLLVFIMIYLFDMRITRHGMLWDFTVPFIAAGCTALNVYILFIFYSFTKHLGLGTLPTGPVVVHHPSNYGEIFVPPTSARNATMLNIGGNSGNLTNTGVTNINSVSNINDTTPYHQTYQATQINNSYPSFVEKIVLANPVDVSFAQTAQNAVVDEVILPSGIKVPVGRDGKSWRIIGNEIVLI